MKFSITTSIILIATAVFPVEGKDIFAKFYRTPAPVPAPTPAPTPTPTNNPNDEPSKNPYEADSNKCVNYPDGKTDDDCLNGSYNGLFDGEYYSHSYKCTEGEGHACCHSTVENQSNVQDLGQCTRNHQPDASGCIRYNDANSDEGCYNTDLFNGYDFSYSCTEGESYVCCDSDVGNLSNVQNQGQCKRNNNRRNLRRRA